MVAIAIRAEEFQMADEFSNLVRQMNQLVDREMNRSGFGFSPLDAFRPAVNLYETDAAFVICADLAGMRRASSSVRGMSKRRPGSPIWAMALAIRVGPRPGVRARASQARREVAAGVSRIGAACIAI